MNIITFVSIATIILERVNQLCSDTLKVQVIKESLSQGKVNFFREELANA